MSLDYYRYVFLRALRKYVEHDLKVLRRGFFPAGGGVLEVKLRGKGNKDEVWLEPGEEFKLNLTSVATRDLSVRRVAERQLRAATKVLTGYGFELEGLTEYVEADSTGSVITAFAVSGSWTSGGDSLGKRGKPAERVGKEAAEALAAALRSVPAVDPHLADNLIPVMAVLGGSIEVTRVTGHLISAVYVCSAFGFNVRLEEDGLVVIRGLG